MSWISFHFPDDTSIRVDGREATHFEVLTEDYARASLGLVYGLSGWSTLREDLAPFLNPEGPLAEFIPQTDVRDNRFDKALGYRLNTIGFSGTALFAWKGVEINTRQLLLNTVLATGSDPLRLAVKIKWQHEIHGYLMGFHRKWMADLIEEGLEEHLYHRDLGWEELVAKLREVNDGPVVTSSSKTDPFPNPHAAGWQGTPGEWEILSDDKRWTLAVKGLKAPGRNRPWSPKDLRYRFGHELSLLDLLRHDTERIEKGLAQQ